MAEGTRLTEEFEKRFNVNVPTGELSEPENEPATDPEYQRLLAERDAARAAYTDFLKKAEGRGE